VIIAIDGPAGSGKSTVSKLIAQKLGFLYIDTGAIYRALTLKALEQKIDFQDVPRLIETAKNTAIDLSNNADGSLKVLLDSRDVAAEIRKPAITKYVSEVAKIKGVREIVLGLERRLGKSKDSVLDGRDIGTVVFPEAEIKFYLDAQFPVRVERRYKELRELGQGVSRREVEDDLHNRDTIDSTRECAPLRKAEDALYVDTTNLNIQQVVEKVLNYING